MLLAIATLSVLVCQWRLTLKVETRWLSEVETIHSGFDYAQPTVVERSRNPQLAPKASTKNSPISAIIKTILPSPTNPP